MAKDEPIVKISITKDGKQWFLYPSDSIKKKVIERGIQKSGFGVYDVSDNGRDRMMTKIQKITDLILEIKQEK